MKLRVNGPIIIKVFLSLILLFICVWVGLILGAIMMLFGTGMHWVITVLAVFATGVLYGILRLLRFPYRRVLNRCACGLLAAALVFATASSGFVWYKKNVLTVDQEVDLEQYRPFADNTLAVRLDTPSSLVFTPGEDLPRLNGATALYPLYASFAQAVYPEGDYPLYGDTPVQCSTTDRAYEMLLWGECDILFAAGPSDEQLELARKQGVEMVMTPIGREAFVFFVNAKNPVQGLTVQQIRDIYSGKTVNWAALGGKNAAIRPFQRPQNSGSQTALQRLMGDTPLIQPPTENVTAGMGGIISQTAAYQNTQSAVGYTFRFYATQMMRENRIRLLSLDGVFPTVETIRDGSYPVTSSFYAITAGEPENPQVRAFIDWILSPEGQMLVEKTGYVPLDNGN